MDDKRKADIQKYIDSLANTDAYNEDSYVIRLENFEGPIDLLWFLIRRSKIDISEIFSENFLYNQLRLYIYTCNVVEYTISVNFPDNNETLQIKFKNTDKL